jgi:hypothetical protein
MKGHRTTWSLGVLTALVLAAGPLAAQQTEAQDRHVLDREEAWATMAERADRAEQQREMIRSVLDRPEVERTAEAHGLDLTRAQDAVSTLDGEELQQVARRADRLDKALTGGADTVVISTTTIIIALLVLIIILVA